MLRLFFPLSLFPIISCSQNDKMKDDNIEIVIKIAQSYKYDLTRGAYTIFNIQGDSTIHFHLSEKEKQQIVQKYYSLGLDKFKGKQAIEDNCLVMPKLFTTLHVKSNKEEQEIIIDEDCDDYKGIFDSKGKNIAAFLKFIDHTLHGKQEIKNAPLSDIIYL